MSIEEVKSQVDGLQGEQLRISVNKGRKRVVKYDGCIERVFPSVFTLRILNDKYVDTLSCSYSDVICGDIKLSEK